MSHSIVREPQWVKFPSYRLFAKETAKKIYELAVLSVRERGFFSMVLSGGKTPRGIYECLSNEYSNTFPWGSTHFFFGDERMVASEHADSNYRLARDTLFQKGLTPSTKIHRVKTELHDPKKVAAQYEQELVEFFKEKSMQKPVFDLILLGLGSDGHTASLFPNNTALQAANRFVISTYVEHLKAFRVTVTLPVINGAKNVFFAVSGHDKQRALKQIVELSRKKETDPAIPASFVRPKNGNVLWLVAEDLVS